MRSKGKRTNRRYRPIHDANYNLADLQNHTVPCRRKLHNHIRSVAQVYPLCDDREDKKEILKQVTEERSSNSKQILRLLVKYFGQPGWIRSKTFSVVANCVITLRVSGSPSLSPPHLSQALSLFPLPISDIRKPDWTDTDKRSDRPNVDQKATPKVNFPAAIPLACIPMSVNNYDEKQRQNFEQSKAS